MRPLRAEAVNPAPAPFHRLHPALSCTFRRDLTLEETDCAQFKPARRCLLSETTLRQRVLRADCVDGVPGKRRVWMPCDAVARARDMRQFALQVIRRR